MRREPDYFGDEELVLLYIARKLRRALDLEALLTQRSIDYLVEVDNYTGGIIFRSERAGAFFYVRDSERDAAATVLRENGFSPQQDQE